MLTFEIQKVLLPLFICTINKVDNCLGGGGRMRSKYESTEFNNNWGFNFTWVKLICITLILTVALWGRQGLRFCIPLLLMKTRLSQGTYARYESCWHWMLELETFVDDMSSFINIEVICSPSLLLSHSQFSTLHCSLLYIVSMSGWRVRDDSNEGHTKVIL